MDPLTMGALITTGGALINNWMNGDSNEHNTNVNKDLAMDMAQNGIRYRVEDAQRAGIHPLAALGVNMSSPGAVAFGGDNDYVATAGRAIGEAVSRTKTAEEKALDSLTLAKVRAGIAVDEAQARMYDSLAAKNLQDGRNHNPMPVAVTPPGVKVKPSETVVRDLSDSGKEKASTPGFKEFDIGNGVSILLPGQDASEAFESVPLVGTAVSAWKNLQRGWELLQDPKKRREHYNKDEERKVGQLPKLPKGYHWQKIDGGRYQAVED